MINTERLIVEPFNMKYLVDYFDGFDAEVTKYQWPEPFESMDDAREMLRGFLEEMERGETLLFSILSKDGRFLGSIELHGLTGDCPEIGVWIASPERGRGFGHEALAAVLDYARRACGKREFFFEADIRNEASVRLLQKLGRGWEIADLELETLITDSGKELRLQGHILTAREDTPAGLKER